MTIEMLIGLAVAIVILVIIVAISLGKINFFSKNTDCSSQGGACLPAAECNAGRIYSASCEDKDDNRICCIKEDGIS